MVEKNRRGRTTSGATFPSRFPIASPNPHTHAFGNSFFFGKFRIGECWAAGSDGGQGEGVGKRQEKGRKEGKLALMLTAIEGCNNDRLYNLYRPKSFVGGTMKELQGE